MSPVVLDFESFPIRKRPHYPPVPVGLAIKWPGRKPQYLAWGHPLGGNTHTWEDARKALAEVWDSDHDVLFHHAKFDLCVAYEHFGLPSLPWNRVHDTMYLLFLDDPRAQTFSLKPSAERLLGEPPSERNAVEGWLLKNQPIPGIKMSPAKKSEHYVGAYIAYAPVSLVGPYAIGDVTRTARLFRKLYGSIKKRGMGEAYDRERRLLPVILAMEQEGLRVDLPRLASWTEKYTKAMGDVDRWLCKKTRTTETNWDSAQELIDALLSATLADAGKLGLTPSGKVATNKEAIERGITDAKVKAVLNYRARLAFSLRTFMRPWLEVARETGGTIYTTWHTTRTDDNGARTGRQSSTPNFQNLSKEPAPIFAHEEKGLPPSPIKLPPLPFVRDLIVPYRPGHVLIDRDFSQQELRILGHYEGDVLLKAYLDNPWLDIHDLAQKLVNKMLGTDYKRKAIKTLGFGIVYGMGSGELAKRLKITVDQARELTEAYKGLAFPGLKVLNAQLKQRAACNEPIRTWGGRVYFCEPPRIIDGQERNYAYRLLNILIQGSAADCTKEAMIRFFEKRRPDWAMYLTAHDELLVSCPKKDVHRCMRAVRKSMESVQFKVPMLSDGKTGKTWGSLKPYDKEGKRVR